MILLPFKLHTNKVKYLSSSDSGKMFGKLVPSLFISSTARPACCVELVCVQVVEVLDTRHHLVMVPALEVTSREATKVH